MRLIQQSSKYLKKAQESFKKGEYSECLEFCSLASGILSEIQDNPNFVAKNKPFLQMLTMLADMALDHKDESTSLFAYYQIIKDSKTSDAQQEIIAMIENFDKNLFALNLALQSIQEADIDRSDGILYKDFQKIADDIGFKEAFEDLMFSTKIIFTHKGDFLFFMQNLVDYGFKDVAMNYFENVGNILFLDKDFLRIYKQILKAGDYKWKLH